MIWIFFTALGVVLYTYVGYPVFMALLARLRPSPWVQAAVPFSASVLLPVHNGMSLLPWKLGCLQKMDPGLIKEIIVIVDGGNDGAAEWLGQQTHDARLRSVILPQQQGKSAALRKGMELATAEILLFIDVRPDITEDAIRQLLSNFAEPTVGCVAGELLVQTDSDAATSAVGGLYWRYEQWIRTCESAFDSPVGVYGGFYALRRNLAVPPTNGLILDDMFQPLWTIRQGYRSVVDRHAIVRDRWPATQSGEFQRKVRTLAGNFQLVAEQPWLLTFKNPVLFQFVSHKLLRLAIPYCLVLMLFSACGLAMQSRTWAAIALAQVFFLLLGIAGDRIHIPVLRKVASALSALLLLNAAAVWALWVYLSTPAPLWKIWKATPAPTQRLPAG